MITLDELIRRVGEPLLGDRADAADRLAIVTLLRLIAERRGCDRVWAACEQRINSMTWWLAAENYVPFTDKRYARIVKTEADYQTIPTGYTYVASDRTVRQNRGNRDTDPTVEQVEIAEHMASKYGPNWQPGDLIFEYAQNGHFSPSMLPAGFRGQASARPVLAVVVDDDRAAYARLPSGAKYMRHGKVKVKR